MDLSPNPPRLCAPDGFLHKERPDPVGSATADVVMVGARLGGIVKEIREQALAAVLPLPDRYNQTLGKAPWVAAIAVTRIEKGGSGLGC